MALRVQEEATEDVMKLMVKLSKLTAKALVAALVELLRKLENREPVGQAQLKDLMRHDAKIETTRITARDAASLDKEMRVFEQMARRFGVGYSIVKIPDQPGYIVFFRARQMEQMSALLSEFMRTRFWRESEVPGDKEAPSREAGRDDRKGENLENKLARAKVQVAQENAARVPTKPQRVLER